MEWKAIHSHNDWRKHRSLRNVGIPPYPENYMESTRLKWGCPKKNGNWADPYVQHQKKKTPIPRSCDEKRKVPSTAANNSRAYRGQESPRQKKDILACQPERMVSYEHQGAVPGGRQLTQNSDDDRQYSELNGHSKKKKNFRKSPLWLSVNQSQSVIHILRS